MTNYPAIASAVLRSQVPRLLRPGQRTPAGTGAYFDLLALDDNFRRYYGDSVHLGWYPAGTETLREATAKLTDLVIRLACIEPGGEVLDAGCGTGAPAIRAATTAACHVTGINVSRRQIRQGRLLVAQAGLAGRVSLCYGDALAMPFPDGAFRSVMCLEVATDICGTPQARDRLLDEIWRVLEPGGTAGFCDLNLRQVPGPGEDRAVRALLYHSGAEMAVDWPAYFRKHGFDITSYADLHEETLATWEDVQDFWQLPAVNRGPGKYIARQVQRRLAELVPVIRRYGTYPAFSARKP